MASDLKVEAILARVASHDTQISPGEVKDYYRSNREAFFIPEQRSACHILISTENQYSHLPKNSPLSRIRKIHALLLESPGRFGEQARRYSDCTSSPDGGKLGRVKPDELCPELNQVLFTLREGELSDTIETPLGFHLLYCEKIHPRQPMIFADAYLKIRQLLGREKKLRSCREWIESLLADQ
ncbi:MAG: peptidylprolyl isomerase [Thermodesulfobacteriota bacterium]